jgi:predicted amidophosphoribosyltransferase
MPTVAELSDPYANFMLAPRPGRGTCEVCFTFTEGYERCFVCAHSERWLDAVAPISYSAGHEQLHRALAGYKRLRGGVAGRLQLELAAVVWRHLAGHEPCLAKAAGVRAFDVVTTVPSSDLARDARHPLRRIAGALVGPTRDRYERLLTRSSASVGERAFSVEKYGVARTLGGEAILLIDDTWTTGANAQSAAATLRRAGAGAIGALVIGRHVNRDFGENDRRLRGLAQAFDWGTCAWHQHQ